MRMVSYRRLSADASKLCKLSFASSPSRSYFQASLPNTIDLDCICSGVQEDCGTWEILSNLNNHDVDASKISKASVSGGLVAWCPMSSIMGVW